MLSKGQTIGRDFNLHWDNNAEVAKINDWRDQQTKYENLSNSVVWDFARRDVAENESVDEGKKKTERWYLYIKHQFIRSCLFPSLLDIAFDKGGSYRLTHLKNNKP